MSPVIRQVLSAAVVAVIVCGAAACVSSPARTAAERAADGTMADRVTAAFDADQWLYARHITVRADRGVVTLGGYVGSPEEQEAAVGDTHRVPGVIRVVDRIQIDRGAIGNSGVAR